MRKADGLLKGLVGRRDGGGKIFFEKVEEFYDIALQIHYPQDPSLAPYFNSLQDIIRNT